MRDRNCCLVALLLAAALFILHACGTTPPTAELLFAQPGDFGDAKLVALGDTTLVVATLDGYLQYKQGAGGFARTTPAISANWLGVAPVDARIAIAIVGSFHENSIRAYKIDFGNGSATRLSTISGGDLLKIDPTIAITPAGYFATYTQIRGAINNADQNKENGEYTVFLFRSGDLVSWKYVSTIIQARNNIEDGRLFFDGGDSKLYFAFEREIVDKGHSSIEVISSADLGAHWAASTVLLEARADQEPGGFVRDGDRFYLYYSSDIEHQGTGSYEYAHMKKAIFKLSFESLQKDIDVSNFSSTLLLDVLPRGTDEYYLFIQHYLTKDKQLMLLRRSQ
jgi:hypothetical protein